MTLALTIPETAGDSSQVCNPGLATVLPSDGGFAASPAMDSVSDRLSHAGTPSLSQSLLKAPYLVIVLTIENITGCKIIIVCSFCPKLIPESSSIDFLVRNCLITLIISMVS